jgi:superfamily II DNA or RNA helicase
MIDYRSKIIEILSDSKSWANIKSHLESYNISKTGTYQKDKIAGKLFEYFAKGYFIIEPEQSQLYKNVWLYNEIPNNIKEKLSLPCQDYGVDLILQNHYDQFFAVQCKFKNDEGSVLQWTKDKLGNTFGLAEKCIGVIIFTNASGVHSIAHGRDKFKLISLGNLVDINPEIISLIKIYFEENKPLKISKSKPKPHQQKALKKTSEYFRTNDRGQLIMPCGSGKTLTALWLKESLKSKKTLVLFPSLALLRQFKTEWSWHRNVDFDYLCVCSEKDIDKNSSDATITHTYEISGDVSTDPTIISSFLKRGNSIIIFSTYQSIEAVAAALTLDKTIFFDLVICDEAHRTSGSKKKNQFTLVHDDNIIRAKKRLYMTATPKVVSNKLKTSLGEDYDLLCDMSNPEIFGNEAFRMSFAEAIKEKILVDYKIIGIGVTHKQVKEFIDKKRYINNKYSIDEIAHNYALNNVMEKYSAFHSISFHSKVSYARNFAERHNSFFQDTIFSRYVEGNQPTSYRLSILNQFKNSRIGVVSNARCLTEGVDVPIIDMIYFCDPKTSKIDIVQASGRALRKDKHGVKTEGYIVVPIFHYINEDIEKEIDKKPYFQNLVSVIRSLCDQDERLQAEINEIAFNRSEKKSKHIQITYDDYEIERIIKLEGLETKIKDFLFDQIIEKTRNNWEVLYNKLVEYKKVYGDTEVSRRQPGMQHLSYWVYDQRRLFHLGKLNSEKIKRLEELGFDWKGENRREITNIDELWRHSYEKLLTYYLNYGNSNVPARYSEDKSLGTWCVAQRVKYDENKLSDWQINLLEELDFKWEPKSSFEKFYNELLEYKKKYGHCKVPFGKKEYIDLGRWVNKLRRVYKYGYRDERGNIIFKYQGTIRAGQLRKLNEIGFIWKANVDWDSHFKTLEKYFHKNGHSNINQNENQKLYYWCYRQKKHVKDLSEEQISALKSVNFNFTTKRILNNGPRLTDWMQRLKELENYYNSKGNFKIPSDIKKYKGLFYWLDYQKDLYRKGRLAPEKIQALEEINFSFNKENEKADNIIPIPKFEEKKQPTLELWKDIYLRLITYKLEKGHCNVPRNFRQDRELSNFVVNQRDLYRQGKLSTDQIKKMELIGFKWEVNADPTTNIRWAKNYNKLAEILKNTPKLKARGLIDKSLDTWIKQQRVNRKKSKLSEEQISLLDKIGFEWHPGTIRDLADEKWLQMLQELENFKEKFGDCNVPQVDKVYRKLGRWVNDQRVYYNKGKLITYRKELLEDLGMIWNIKEYEWANKIKALQDFFLKYNHFNVTQSNKDYPGLYNCLYRLKKKGTSIEKINQLKILGFDISDIPVSSDDF